MNAYRQCKMKNYITKSSDEWKIKLVPEIGSRAAIKYLSFFSLISS